MNADLPEKTCDRCGRRFAWRKKWAKDWDNVRYCSAACRRHKPGAQDQDREDRILNALRRMPGRDLPLHELADQPSEVEPLRRAARRLALAGKIVLRQSGRVIDPRDLHGPVDIASV